MSHYFRWPVAELPSQVGSDMEDGSRIAKNVDGFLSYGPYCRLEKGRYFAGFYLQKMTGSKHIDPILIDVRMFDEPSQSERFVVVRQVPADELSTSIAGLVGVEFSIEDGDPALEVRLQVNASAEILAKSLVIFRVDTL